MLRVVFVTAPVKKAEALARQLLEERLIACANLIPKVKSMYWWKDKIETDAETLIVMKTPKRNIKNLIPADSPLLRLKSCTPLTIVGTSAFVAQPVFVPESSASILISFPFLLVSTFFQ